MPAENRKPAEKPENPQNPQTETENTPNKSKSPRLVAFWKNPKK